MNTAPAGFFGTNINGMDASNKLPYFPPEFIGDLEVAVCKGITTRDGKRAFIAEVRVLTTNMPDRVRVDAMHSWYQDLTEAGTAYPSCIAFLYAALGLDQVRDKVKIDTEVKPRQDAYLNMAVNDNPQLYGGRVNILKGAKIHLQTSNIVTKKKKENFTIHNFTPYVAPAA